jgi:hypothetical protein
MSGGLETATILEPFDELGEGGILFINDHRQFIDRRVLWIVLEGYDASLPAFPAQNMCYAPSAFSQVARPCGVAMATST